MIQVAIQIGSMATVMTRPATADLFDNVRQELEEALDGRFNELKAILKNQ